MTWKYVPSTWHPSLSTAMWPTPETQRWPLRKPDCAQFGDARTQRDGPHEKREICEEDQGNDDQKYLSSGNVSRDREQTSRQGFDGAH